MEDEKETYIHAKCSKSDKSSWIKAAKSKNLKLTEWVIKSLNNSVKITQYTENTDEDI